MGAPFVRRHVDVWLCVDIEANQRNAVGQTFCDCMCLPPMYVYYIYIVSINLYMVPVCCHARGSKTCLHWFF